jgi:hypothetical protein
MYTRSQKSTTAAEPSNSFHFEWGIYANPIRASHVFVVVNALHFIAVPLKRQRRYQLAQVQARPCS